jgi:hypothetical protein
MPEAAKEGRRWADFFPIRERRSTIVIRQSIPMRVTVPAEEPEDGGEGVDGKKSQRHDPTAHKREA